jgi:hypothetical protein
MFDNPASIIIILSAYWFFRAPAPEHLDQPALTVSYMADTGNFGDDGHLSLSRGKNLFDVSVQSAPLRYHGLRVGASVMYDRQDSTLAGPGIGKTVDVRSFDATLFIYPSYSDLRGHDRSTNSGRLNWRTTLDFSRRLGSRTKAGIGLMHVSNGGYSQPNDGIDALRVTFEYVLR